MIINLKGNEGSLLGTGTGNTFFDSTCIKVNVTSTAVITLYDSADAQIGNTTLLATNTYFVEKAHTDKIKLNSGTVTATPVGFTIS